MVNICGPIFAMHEALKAMKYPVTYTQAENLNVFGESKNTTTNRITRKSPLHIAIEKKDHTYKVL